MTSLRTTPKAAASRNFALLLRVALLTVAAACRQESAPQEEAFAGVKKREPARVMVEPVARREMVRRLETTTRVESESHVLLYPRTAGVVVEMLVEEGAVVAGGAVLARLDDRDAKLRLDDARAALVDGQANLPKLELAVREASARLETSKKTAEQSTRDHDRSLALSRGSGTDGPALISSKDLEASSLAKSTAWAAVEQNELALERAKVERKNGETAIERARVAVERAELELSYTQIVAYVGGVVAERSIKVGDTISTATLAFTITDPQRLRAVFHRPQRELDMFLGALHGPANGGSDGPTAELELHATAEAIPGRSFKGRIERIAPTIDAASGNFRVTASLDAAAEGHPSARLLPGMLIRIEIVTDRHPQALVVPKRAVRREGDRTTVFVIRDGTAHSVEVSESFADDMSVEIVPAPGAKLEAGESVVVVGNRDLEEGGEVRITSSEPQANTAAEPKKNE
jgi:RND family efflux transporter MFP subunit